MCIFVGIYSANKLKIAFKKRKKGHLYHEYILYTYILYNILNKE